MSKKLFAVLMFVAGAVWATPEAQVGALDSVFLNAQKGGASAVNGVMAAPVMPIAVAAIPAAAVKSSPEPQQWKKFMLNSEESGVVGGAAGTGAVTGTIAGIILGWIANHWIGALAGFCLGALGGMVAGAVLGYLFIKILG